MDIEKLEKADFEEKDEIYDLLQDTYADNPDEYFKIKNKCRKRAKELRVLKVFDERLGSRNIETKKKNRTANTIITYGGNTAKFPPAANGTHYPIMSCDAWRADENGIYQESTDANKAIYACRHPILITRKTFDEETHMESVTIAFYRGKWRECIAPKSIIVSANKIVELANYGIGVTSETAKTLVRFLSDLETENYEHIPVDVSSSKLGWHDNYKYFLPYDSDITFSGDAEFKDILTSINRVGNDNEWFDHVKELRKTAGVELKIILATSFASVLVSMMDILPFIVDVWGESGTGKSVLLMLAASVWANPEESKYIGDLETTPVQLEVRADMLNHLPMILDDTSKISKRLSDDFEGLVYRLCAGKGKSRSNKALGIQRERHWNNCTITNGERPLSGYVTQGGAINRIIEVMCDTDIFPEPRKTLKIIKNNYGHAGRAFIDVVKSIKDADAIANSQKGNNESPQNTIQNMYDMFVDKLTDKSKTPKQIMAMAAILTADKLIEKYLFDEDGQTISAKEASVFLVSMAEMSDGKRCYEYVMSKVDMNMGRFGKNLAFTEQWGEIDEDEGCIYFFTTALSEVCKAGGFSKKTFLNWAKMNRVLVLGKKGEETIVKKIGVKSRRVHKIKMSLPEEQNNNDQMGFISLPDGQQTPFD